MRSPAEIEADVRAAMVRWSAASGSEHAALWGLSHSIVHWRSRGLCSGAIVEASLVLDPVTTVRDAHALAGDLRVAVLRAVPDVHEIDLHLELFDGSLKSPASIGTCRHRDELPPDFRLGPGSGEQ